MQRKNRYQAAIVKDGNILLIQHREHTGRAYWLLPGGGREDGETEEECVQREMREETNLEVNVEGLLLDEPPPLNTGGFYERFKTYLCSPLTQDASPGYEPEPEVSAVYAIAAVGWYSLDDETTWDEAILNDDITAPTLRRIRDALKSWNGKS